MLPQYMGDVALAGNGALYGDGRAPLVAISGMARRIVKAVCCVVPLWPVLGMQLPQLSARSPSIRVPHVGELEVGTLSVRVCCGELAKSVERPHNSGFADEQQHMRTNAHMGRGEHLGSWSNRTMTSCQETPSRRPAALGRAI